MTSRSPFDLVLVHFPAEGIAVDTEDISRFREAASRAAQHSRDEPLLEFLNSVVEMHAALDHIFDEFFESL